MPRTISLTLLAVALAAVEEATPTIVVTAERGESDLARATVSIDVVEASQITDRGGVSDAVDWFAGLSGVGVFRRYGGIDGGVPEVRLRGLESRYTQVLIDGIPVNDASQINGDANFAFLSPVGAQRLEVLKGSQSGLYGSRAIGGVADFRLLRPTAAARSQISASGGSHGTIGGQMQASGPMSERVGYAAAIEAVHSDGFSATTPNLDGDPGDYERDVMERLSFSGRLEWRVADALTCYASVLGGRNRQALDDYRNIVGSTGWSESDVDAVATANDPVASIRVDTVRVAAGGEGRQGGWSYGFDAAHTTIKRENDTINGLGYVSPTWVPDNVTNTYDSSEVFASARLRYQAEAGWRLGGGMDGRQQQAGQQRGDGSNWSADDRLIGVYAQAGWTGGRYEFDAVLRHDAPQGYANEQNGRISAGVFLIEDTLKLRGALADGYRAPSLYERYAYEVTSYGPTVGNPDLHPEHSRSGEAGIDWTPAPRARLAATWFRTDFTDKIDYDYGSPNSTFINRDGRSRSDGLEASAEVEDIAGSGLDFNSWYTFQETEDPQGRDLAYTPKHRGGARAVLRQDMDGRWGMWESLSVERLSSYYSGASEAGRVDGYTLASAAVGASIGRMWEASLRVENLFDERYLATSSYGVAYSTMPRSYFATVTAKF
jgi:vitamin B12 transporter